MSASAPTAVAPSPRDAFTLASRLENLLAVYAKQAKGNSVQTDDDLAAVGDAEDAVDEWLRSQGQDVSEPVELPLTRIISRARHATTPAAIETLRTNIVEHANLHVGMYTDALARNAASPSDERVGRWCYDHEDGCDSIRASLARNPYLTTKQATSLVTAIRAPGRLYGRSLELRQYPLLHDVLTRHPSVLTPELMAEIAADIERTEEPAYESVKEHIANLLVDILLPRGILTPAQMARAVVLLGNADRIQTLIGHQSATMEVWLAYFDKPGGIIDMRLIPMFKSPRVMAHREMRQVMVDRVAALKIPINLLKRLAWNFPPEAVNEPLMAIARIDAVACLDAIQALPPERRAAVDASILGEIAAIHPDGKVRQQAMLLAGDTDSVNQGRPQAQMEAAMPISR